MFENVTRDSAVLDNSLLTSTEKKVKSILMRDILEKVLMQATSDLPVVIIGEIGSGKKRIAKIIHENSDRAAFPFFSFYCLDLDDNEYEEAFREHLKLQNEYFSLEYYAIEKACNGILYMDQFSELPPPLMLKIVRSFIQGSEQIYRYSTSAQPRLILAMNMESYPSVIKTPEWERILQLLNPNAIMIPPLRERTEDISLLIYSYLKEMREKDKKYENLVISEEALAACASYSWPGNIMQLKNALMQGAILSHGQTIEKKHLPFSISWQLPYNIEKSDIIK